MPLPAEPLPRAEIHPLRGAGFLRGLHRVLPLGRKYYPLVGALNPRHGLLAVPFDKYHVLHPAQWTKAITKKLLFGTDVIPECSHFIPLCRQATNGALIDLGANTGLYTLLMRANSRLPIIAYEPQPILFRLLRWNVQFNELPDVDLRNIACGSKKEEVDFWLGLNGSVLPQNGKNSVPIRKRLAGETNWEEEARLAQEGRTVIKVQVTTLDEDLANGPRIALMKIDCEGFEYEILRGGRALLERDRPRLFIELHPETLKKFGHSVEKVLDLLTADYEMEFWYFKIGRATTKLGHSLEKFRKPKGHRCADAAEMVAATKAVPGPNQVYLIGTPKRPR